jgi:hypothetical protein
MKARVRLVLIACVVAGAGDVAFALGIPKSSVSASRQFIVYCDDTRARIAVTSFAEETKSDILGLLGQRDKWKLPIVIQIRPVSTANVDDVPSRVGLYEVEGGTKVEIDVRLGDDPTEAQFPRQLIRAVLLEFAYRNEPPIKAGAKYNEPPQWLVEAIAQRIETKHEENSADIFKALIEVNQMPSLRQFISGKEGKLDFTSLALYRAYAVSLLQLVLEQPNGKSMLARYVAHLPRSSGDVYGEFCSQFSAISESERGLEKWWTISLARLSAADRYKGMSFDDTLAALEKALDLKVPLKPGEKPVAFALSQFREFVKLPQSREPLRQMDADLLRLSTRSNALLRPAVVEYQRIARLLSRGKTTDIGPRILAVTTYCDMLEKRILDITDYMNWFEATKPATRSDAFDAYLKTAGQLASQKTLRDDAISLYMDRIEKECQ